MGTRNATLIAFTLALLLGCSGEGEGFGVDDDTVADDDAVDDDTGADDDDDTVPQGGCPNAWHGFGDDPDPDSWDMLVLYAIGDPNFDIGERHLRDYGLQVVDYGPGEDTYFMVRNAGLCFSTAGGIFRGDDEYYGGDFFSVSVTMNADDGWGGGIQVIPDDGGEPYLLERSTPLRGLAIEPDGVGGFVVCGATAQEDDNAILWVNGDGDEVVEHPLPDGGSCYDVAEGWDGTFWVTDLANNLLLNFDLDTGEFEPCWELPEPGLDWVVSETAGDQIMVAADNEIWVYEADTGEDWRYASMPPLGITSHHVTNIHWSFSWGVTSMSKVMRDYPTSGLWGPHSARIEGGPDPDGELFEFQGADQILDGEVILDYVLLGDLQ